MLHTVVLPILHPSHIMQGQWAQEEHQVRYLSRAGAYLEPGWQEPQVGEGPPGGLLRPTVNQIEQFCQQVRTHGCAVDIEAAGAMLVSVQLWARQPLPDDWPADAPQGVVVKFRAVGGDPEPWSYPDWCRVVRALLKLFMDPRTPKVFQRGQAYDVPVLWLMGWPLAGYTDVGFDTLLGHHVAKPESPKALGLLGTSVLGLPGWKHLSKAEEGKDK